LLANNPTLDPYAYDLNKAADLLQFALHFPQRVTFSRPRAAAEQGDKTP